MPRRLISIAILVVMLGAIGCGSDSENTAAVCTLSVKALTSITGEFRRGAGASRALAALEPATAKLCEAVVDGLFGQPETPVSFQLKTSSGLVPQTVALQSLAAPSPTVPASPSSVPSGGLQRTIDCSFGYDSKFLVDLCVDGTIDPPGA
ncbi:MAG: hypothetical protein WKF43_06345 [Acidimicrobiales bacterium]